MGPVHLRDDLGTDPRCPRQDARRVWRRGRAQPRTRVRARHREALRTRLGACSRRRVTELFRAMPVLIMMMLLYYGLPSVGIKMDPYWAVVIAPRRLQRFGARRGTARRHRIAAKGAEGGRLRNRAAQERRDAAHPVAAGSPRHAPSDHLAARGDDERHRARLYHYLPELLYLAKQFSSNVQYGRPLLPVRALSSAASTSCCASSFRASHSLWSGGSAAARADRAAPRHRRARFPCSPMIRACTRVVPSPRYSRYSESGSETGPRTEGPRSVRPFRASPSPLKGRFVHESARPAARSRA